MNEGRLLARGRDGDIFELGPHHVLRKARGGRSIAQEARVMQYVAEHGYPVPHVEEVRANGTEIVMERINGPMMMDAMVKRPWTQRFSHTLADLHDQLHAIPAPSWLPQLDTGDALLHLDLHPLNVMMSSRGPVVIDWANAARGDALTDIGFTYALLTCPDVPGPWIVRAIAQPLRIVTARAFSARYRGPAFEQHLALAAELKMLDSNMSAREVARLARLAEKAKARG